MLTYLIETVNRLVIPALCFALMWAYCKDEGKHNHTMRIGFLVGIVLSGIMTYMKTFTVYIDTSLWNVRNFWVSIVTFVLLLLFVAVGRKRKKIAPL